MVKIYCKEIRLITKLKENYSNIVIVHTVFSVHIRRTDKIGSSHKLEEYMYYVEQYYMQQQMNGKDLFKTIYLATDDPTLFKVAYKRRVEVVLFLLYYNYNSAVF